MAIPTFEKSGSSNFLYLLKEDISAGSESKYCIAFFTHNDIPDASLKLADTWNNHAGVYLFLKFDKTTFPPPEFEKKLNNLLNEPAYQHVRFIWLENPADSLPNWRMNFISAQPQQTATATLNKLALIDLRNYSLGIARGSQIELVELNENEDGFKFSRADDNPEGFFFSTGYGANRLKGVGNSITIPLHGENAGCLQFDLTLKRPPQTGGEFVDRYHELIHLDVGQRLFFKDPSVSITDTGFYVRSRHYPMLSEDAGSLKHYPADLKVYASLDPLNLLDEQRSNFGFIEPSSTTKPSPVPSGFRTNLGYTVFLQPHDQNSRLQFAISPASSRSDSEFPLYLVPSGEFEMSVPRHDPNASQNRADFDDNLLCGLSGVEYIKIASDATSLLCFKPGYPSFAPAFNNPEPMVEKLLALIRINLSDTAIPLAMDKTFEEQFGIFKLTEQSLIDLKSDGLPDDVTEKLEDIKNQKFTGVEEFLKILNSTIGGGLTNKHKLLILKHAKDIKATSKKELTFKNEILPVLQSFYFPAGFQFDLVLKDELWESELNETITLLQLLLQESTAELAAESGEAVLTEIATTSWVYVRQTGTNRPIYYAQPDQAVLFKPTAVTGQDDTPEDEFLEYMEIPATGLPDTLSDDQLLAFPLFPYGGVDSQILTDFRQIELQILSAMRRARIYQISEADNFSAPLSDDTTATASFTGATPQGLKATYSGTYESLESLLLARDTADKNFQLTNIERSAKLRAALQSNQLFMVISDPDVLKDYFKDNQLTIDGWAFDLNPEGVDDNGKNIWKKRNTILVFKFYDKPLRELVEDIHVWAFPGDFNRDPKATRARLKRLIKDAITRGKSNVQKDREKYGVLARAAKLEEWSGIIALNVNVPPKNFPDEIKALTAGIDPEKFFAQFAGIEVTPIIPKGNTLEAKQSSLFALIDYNDDSVPLPNNSGYDFQVSKLSAVFLNSQLRHFSAELNITLDKLFDERSQLLGSETGRNIVILKGAAERQNDKVTYSFAFSGKNRFALPESHAIGEVDIIKAQLTTDPVTGDNITGRFSFWGQLRFRYLEAFDILSFGPEPTGQDSGKKSLSFSNLQVLMQFDINDPQAKTFEFEPRNMAFDTKQSKVREQSLFSNFPLKFTGFTYSDNEKRIADFGYMPVKSPLSGQTVTDKWYGLTFDLELGTLGALAGKAGFVVSIVAAWSPATEAGSKGIFVGLRMPGSVGGKKEISLQGVLKLAFKSILFVVGKDQKGNTAYLLKLRNIVLKALILSLPPSAQSEIIIFGDPEGTVEKRNVGWFAAYSRDP